MTQDPTPTLVWCRNPWCGEVFEAREGWAGRCPSCLALADEHGAGAHTVTIDACAECRREPMTHRRSRSA